ncbi:CRP-like cAMP-binding protein [Bradyrhizobium barranii subsp. barranii]
MPSDTIRAALVRRLRTSSGISDDDVKEIEALPIAVRQYPADTPVVRDGERATNCCLIADGFCARSKTISSGKRQILSIHIPGEIPDLMSLFLHVMDHDLSTLAPCTLGFISHETLRKLHQRSPSVAEMFWRDTLIDAAMFREWIVNVGQRPAPARLAHVMIELRERLRVIGRLDGNSFEMPLTQEQIGEALGNHRGARQPRDQAVAAGGHRRAAPRPRHGAGRAEISGPCGFRRPLPASVADALRRAGDLTYRKFVSVQGAMVRRHDCRTGVA